LSIKHNGLDPGPRFPSRRPTLDGTKSLLIAWPFLHCPSQHPPGARPLRQARDLWPFLPPCPSRCPQLEAPLFSPSPVEAPSTHRLSPDHSHGWGIAFFPVEAPCLPSHGHFVAALEASACQSSTMALILDLVSRRGALPSMGLHCFPLRPSRRPLLIDSTQTMAMAGALPFFPLKRLVCQAMGIASLPSRRPLVNQAQWP
jgi:hypothetical protein